MAGNSKKSKEYRELHDSLMQSLETRGLTGAAYVDKVQEYMDFWELRRQLRADIEKRGLTVIDDRGRSVENRSVSLEIQVSRQMLAIWAALGLKPEDAKGMVNDDDL